MGWDGPILTDSGGYQVFSMADLASMDEDASPSDRSWMAIRSASRPSASWTLSAISAPT